MPHVVPCEQNSHGISIAVSNGLDQGCVGCILRFDRSGLRYRVGRLCR